MESRSRVRVAIVHYWLLEMRGGEKVVETLCKMYPSADLFTLFYSPDGVSPAIRAHKVTSSFLNPLRRFHRSLLPLMPVALESLDLRGYDLVISSESGPAKGVIVSANTRHICYVHSPMRYLWELYPHHLHDWTSSRLKRVLMAPVANYLRLWDYASAARVDRFIANSENVRRRVRRAWGRDAVVVHPPVPVDQFYWKPSGDYCLIVSKLVQYKRVDLAVRAFSETGRKLKIVGDGPEFKNLKRNAGPSIEFCGHVPDDQLRDLYAHSRALLMPGEEDFGMTMVESLASGKPVIAQRRGGAMEILSERDPVTGVFFDTADSAALRDAMQRFEHIQFDASALQHSALRFSEAAFGQGIRQILNTS